MAIPNSLKPIPLPLLPNGFKFRPSDKQLLGHYLYKKVAGPAYSDAFVRECDIYGEQEPWEIWRDFGGETKADSKDLHFFTKLKSKTTNGSRKDRTIGRGTWKGEDSGTKVWGDLDHRTKERKLLGLKKRFRYETGRGGALRQKLDARWIMFEYALDASSLPPSYEAKNYVLCVLRRLKNNKREADDEPTVNVAAKRLETEEVAPFHNCIGYGGTSSFNNPSVEPCFVADGSQQYHYPIPASTLLYLEEEAYDQMSSKEAVRGDECTYAEDVEVYDMVMKELDKEGQPSVDHHPEPTDHSCDILQEQHHEEETSEVCAEDEFDTLMEEPVQPSSSHVGDEGQKGRPLIIEIEDSDEDVEGDEKDEPRIIIDVEEYDDNVKSGANVAETEQEVGGGDNLQQEEDLSWLEEIDFDAFEGSFQDMGFDSFFADMPESSFDISACGFKAADAFASPSLDIATN